MPTTERQPVVVVDQRAADRLPDYPVSAIIDPDKYTVFKTDELTAALQRVVEAERWDLAATAAKVVDLRLDNAVVIRRSDVFATDALFAYAQTIRTALQVMEHYGVGDADEISHLEALADYFIGEAEASDSESHTLPDD